MWVLRSHGGGDGGRREKRGRKRTRSSAERWAMHNARSVVRLGCLLTFLLEYMRAGVCAYVQARAATYT